MHRRPSVTLALAAALLAALPGHAAAQARIGDPVETTADPRDKVICKRFQRTGSLVATYRECKTRWAWERERQELRTLAVSDSCRMNAEPDPLKAGGGCAR